MAIRFRRVKRVCDPTNKEAGMRVYPSISYQYDNSVTLRECAQKIASHSGVSEGEAISVLKDFRTLLKEKLLEGRSVNIEGIGYFYLSAQSKGVAIDEEFTVNHIDGLRICFRASSDIRLFTKNGKTNGLAFKDLDAIEKNSDAPIVESEDEDSDVDNGLDVDNGSNTNGNKTPTPDNNVSGNGSSKDETPYPMA